MFSMEDCTNLSTSFLIDNITFHFTGWIPKNSSVIKLNSENLSVHGELYFLYNFKVWKDLLICVKGCTNILQHYAHTHSITKDNINVTEEIFKQLVLKSNSWPIKIERCILQKERVCIFLNRRDLITNSIRMAFKYGKTFGRNPSTGKAFSLKYEPDVESDLTTQRLRVIKNITAKVLSLHGHEILDEDNSTSKYIFTNKSEGSVAEGYKKYVCGVVKNSQLNSKEVYLTWQEYVKHKIVQLTKLNEHKLIGDEGNEVNDHLLHNLASAVTTFELIAVKPSRPVVIGNYNFEDNKNITNTKGASFILYNTARIATIIAKYNEKIAHGDYPSLPNIEDVDFSQLEEEEEWELIYNFIFGFPRMINDCLRYEPDFDIYPQMLCLFLSRLCQKFSVYYRRIRILMKGDHLIPKVVARLYMLHALQIVLENALDILDIKPLSRM